MKVVPFYALTITEFNLILSDPLLNSYLDTSATELIRKAQSDPNFGYTHFLGLIGNTPIFYAEFLDLSGHLRNDHITPNANAFVPQPEDLIWRFHNMSQDGTLPSPENLMAFLKACYLLQESEKIVIPSGRILLENQNALTPVAEHVMSSWKLTPLGAPLGSSWGEPVIYSTNLSQLLELSKK
jgi:hypothetical protein